jgi:hypothetical protein
LISPRFSRLWFVLAFPLAVATIWFAFAAIANYERTQLVDQLTKQLADGNVRGSLAVVRQLSLTPHALLEPIVIAATSADRNLAGGAQLAISDLLDQWQQQLDAGRHGRLIDDGLNELAADLDANRDAFTAADGPWITRTVGQLVRLANRVSPAELELTTHCESLLAAAGQGHAPRAESNSALTFRNARTASKSITNETTAAIQHTAQTDEHRLADVTPIRDFDPSSAAEGAFSAPPASAYQTITATDAATASLPTDEPASTAHLHPGQISDEHARRGWAATDDNSTLTHRETSDAESGGAVQAKGSDESGAAANPLKSLGSRVLLQRWLSGSERTHSPLEKELSLRGLGKPNAKLVQILFSDRAEDRIHLVQDLMAAPGLNTSAWLSVLAEDPDADVRLAAVTMMGTSTDPQLAEQAYQAALHDRDPRVADLAGRLRDRRDNIQRR